MKEQILQRFPEAPKKLDLDILYKASRIELGKTLSEVDRLEFELGEAKKETEAIKQNILSNPQYAKEVKREHMYANLKKQLKIMKEQRDSFRNQRDKLLSQINSK